ncbi:MAG: hypothetical protein ACJ71S_06465 [Acidobacteriaceae bacterium]|jgi:hypothetical protein
MSRYRKVDPRIWNDAKFRSMTDNGKLAFLMLLTHPGMTALGGMRSTVPGLAEELGWTTEAFRQAFREALRKGMAKHDEKACLIVLPNFLRYNRPESPNVVKAWVESLDLLPECALKAELIEQVRDFAKGMSEAFAKALPEAFAKPMPYQEQEQEQEQEEQTLAQLPLTSGPVVVKAQTRNAIEAIYQQYPRKVAKKDALKAIGKAIAMLQASGRTEREAQEYLYRRAQAFAKSPAGQNGEYTPHPTTWFNRGSFDDDEREWQRPGDNGAADGRKPVPQLKFVKPGVMQ